MILKTDRDSINVREQELADQIYQKWQLILSEFENLAEQVFKNVSDPIIAYIVALTAQNITQDIQEMSLDVFLEQAEKTSNTLNFGFSFDLANKQALQFLQERQQYMAGIHNTTKETILNLYIRGVKGEKTLQEIIKELQNTYWLSRRRAELIATNELGTAYVEGTARQIRQIGLETGAKVMKKWDHVEDSRVTKGCRHNQSLGWMDENFVYPNTDGLGGGQQPPRFIGCRCTMLYDIE